MVSSTATPIATLAVIMVPMSTSTPRCPMAPKISTTGSTFGIIEMSPPRTFNGQTLRVRSRIIMTAAIITNAQPMLLIRLCSSVRCAL